MRHLLAHHNARRWLTVLALPLAAGLASCSRATFPTAGDAARTPSVLASSAFVSPRDMPTAADSGRALARLRVGVQPGDVATTYQVDQLGYVPELRLLLLRVPAGQSASAFAQRLATDSRVEYAEPDLPVGAAETRQASIAFSEGSRQWGDVLDQGALARIGAPEAQQATRGAGVLVAILDTGIDLDHPALAAALDLPGIEPGVTTNPGDDRAENVDTNGDGWIDGALGHGTHVAGIVHAVAPDAHLLAVRVLDSDGVGDAFDLARGLVACTNRGAAVANLSLGMSAPSLSVGTAIDFARAHGVLVAAPTGNLDASTLDFPASDPPVVAVAATDSLDRRAGFSNYGAGVDVAAPGVAILSTYVGGGYAVWSGTSMATPFVSGTGALVYSLLGPRDPSLLGAVEGFVLGGALPLAAVDPTYAAWLGAGRLSAANSVAAARLARSGANGSADPALRRAAP